MLQTPQVKDSGNRIRKTESNSGNRIFGFANPNVQEAEPRPPKQGDATRKPRDTRPTRHSRPADSATKRLRARGAGGRVGRRRRGGRGARGAPRRVPLKYWRGRAGFSFLRVVSFRLMAGFWRIGERQVYPMREAGSEAGALGRSTTATARPTTDRQQVGAAQKYLKGGEGERGGSIGAQHHRDRPLHRPDPTGQREHGTEGGGVAAEGDAGEPQPRSEATAGGRGEGAAGRGAEPPRHAKRAIQSYSLLASKHGHSFVWLKSRCPRTLGTLHPWFMASSVNLQMRRARALRWACVLVSAGFPSASSPPT